MSVTNLWGKAVGNLLERAKVSQASLAAEVGLNRMTMNRYVNGERKPDTVTIRRANEWVAKLTGIPEARDYLFALALRDGLLEARGDDIQFEALVQLLGSLDPYFVGSVWEATSTAFEVANLSKERILALFVDLVKIRAQHILFQLDGAIPTAVSLDEVLPVFRRYGAPLEPYLRLDEEAKRRRVGEFFKLWVEAVITSRFPETSVKHRRGAIGAILEKFGEASDEIVAAVRGTQALSSTHRRESKTNQASKSPRRNSIKKGRKRTK